MAKEKSVTSATPSDGLYVLQPNGTFKKLETRKIIIRAVNVTEANETLNDRYGFKPKYEQIRR